MATEGEQSGEQSSVDSNLKVVAVIPTTRNPSVWQHFDLCEMVSGPNKARCKKCGKFLKPSSNSTLRKHVEMYCKVVKSGVVDDDEDVWVFDENALRVEMAKFVIQQGLSFGYFENPRLTKLFQETIQPLYTPVSGTTLIRECFKMWKNAKNELILEFENLKTGVNLTCDVWKAPYDIPDSYVCVTAHWVDPKTWQMMKRTISFELLYAEDSLFQFLDEIIKTYKLANKVFSISFDNTTDDPELVAQLKIEHKPICNGLFFHNRCVAHIINLVVQDGLEHIENIKESLKQMLRDVFGHSKERYNEYMKFCRDTNNIWLGPNWEIPTQWNSTCNMFECALRQKDSLQMFHDNLVARNLVAQFPSSSWTLIEQISDILGVLKKATTILSGVYYPTSSLVLKHIWKITKKLSEYEPKSEMFSEMIRPMKEKLQNYFKAMPPIFTCAAALNPYVNVAGVEFLIEKTAQNLELEKEDIHFSSNAKADFNRHLSDMFNVYFSRYESLVDTALRNDDKKDTMVSFYNELRKNSLKISRGELERYTTRNFISNVSQQDFENLDILAWWKENEFQFPILATMARDVLTVQASTVALESAFSFSGRTLSLRRSRLGPTSVEMCICLKDHLDATERTQHISNLEGEMCMETNTREEEDEELDYDDELSNSSDDE